MSNAIKPFCLISEVNFPLDTGILPAELAAFLAANEDEELPETIYDDLNDSCSDWLPEDNTVKKKTSDKKRIYKPRKGKSFKITKEERAKLNVESAAAKGRVLDYATELHRIEQRSLDHKERYQVQKKRKLEMFGEQEKVVKKPKVQNDGRKSRRQRAKDRAGKFCAYYRYATFACDQCEVSYREEALLDIHGLSHGKVLDSPPTLICPSCEAVCGGSLDDLLLHIKIHQRRATAKLPKTTEFQCKICRQCYGTNGLLVRHMKIVHPPGGRPVVTYDGAKYPCPDCDKECVTAAGLITHQKVKFYILFILCIFIHFYLFSNILLIVSRIIFIFIFI